MSFFSQFAGGPAKVTQYTSGSGNYTPISTNQSWAQVTVVGGGGGGFGPPNFFSVGGGGGGAGATVVQFIKLNEASYPYVVGAGGGGSSNGSKSYFGTIQAFGGFAPTAGAPAVNTFGVGAFAASFPIFAGGPTFGVPINGIFAGGSVGGGAGGGSGGKGAAAGICTSYSNSPSINEIQNMYAGLSTAGTGSNLGGGGGGDSAYGKGGNGGNGSNLSGTPANSGNAGSGYGSGGGGGGAANSADGGSGGSGAGGLIIIEEFVQA
jgi:hypothetical protein